MTPSKAMKDIRWELRLSQQDLADELGITQAAVSACELGRSVPQFATLKKLVDFAKSKNIEINLFD